MVACVQGVSETVHPYSFVARVGFEELLTASDADSKTIPLLPRLTAALRAALVSSTLVLSCYFCFSTDLE